jgi:hypothetical protein
MLPEPRIMRVVHNPGCRQRRIEMRKWICLAMFLAFALTSAASAISERKSWRVAGTYSGLTTTKGSNVFGNAWGGGAEYSFSDRLTSDDYIPGDISLAVYYRQFRHGSDVGERTANYTSVGLKWRGGAGANAGYEGLYGGVGVGVVWLSMGPNVLPVDQREGVTKLEWSVFGGVNFAHALYAEASYSNIGDFGMDGVNFMFGARF